MTQPEAGESEVVIEAISAVRARFMITKLVASGGQLMQVRPPKVLPRLLEIARLARQDFYRAGLVMASFHASALHHEWRCDQEM
jgi:hypothetical protein